MTGTREDDFDGVPATRPRGNPHSSAPNGHGNGAADDIAFSTAEGLKIKVFPPIKSIAEGYIVEGATILAGKPKIGKSWFALDCGLAVADGGMFLGAYCKKGDVLFIALEDNERRLRSRIEKILGSKAPWPKNFIYATEWPRANEGGLDKIKTWITSRETPRLVVIDVLAAFRSITTGRKDNTYAADYETVKALQTIASEMNVAIMIVHHLRKGTSDDPIDKISGNRTVRRG